MEKKSIAFTAVFMIVIVLLGLKSFCSLIDFYVNDVTDYNEWTADLGNRFETDEASSFYGKLQFINFNGAVRSVLGQHEMNGVIKLNNGHLLRPHNPAADEVVQGYAENIIALNRYLNEKGIAFVYVVPPYTVNKYDPELPAGIHDYANEKYQENYDYPEEWFDETDKIDKWISVHEQSIYQWMYDLIMNHKSDLLNLGET